MIACQNCKHWLGKESAYMGECVEHKQRTEFNHNCSSFSPRAVSAVVDDKPKINDSRQLGNLYWSNGVKSFGPFSKPDDYDAAVSLDIEPFDTSKYPLGQEFSIPFIFTFDNEVWEAFSKACTRCVEVFSKYAACFPCAESLNGISELEDYSPEAAFYQAECDAIAHRAEEDRAAVQEAFEEALAAIDARERDELAILEGSRKNVH